MVLSQIDWKTLRDAEIDGEALPVTQASSKSASQSQPKMAKGFHPGSPNQNRSWELPAGIAKVIHDA